MTLTEICQKYHNIFSENDISEMLKLVDYFESNSFEKFYKKLCEKQIAVSSSNILIENYYRNNANNCMYDLIKMEE